MSNVIEFPVSRKIDVIAGEINNLQGEITVRFETLTKMFVREYTCWYFRILLASRGEV